LAIAAFSSRGLSKLNICGFGIRLPEILFAVAALRQMLPGDFATSGLPGSGALASVFAKSFFDKSFFGQFIDKAVVDRLRRE